MEDRIFKIYCELPTAPSPPMFLQVHCPHKYLVCGSRGRTELPTRDGMDQKLSAPRGSPEPGGGWMRGRGWTSAWHLEMPCLQVSSFDIAIKFFKRKHFSLETGFHNFFFQLERFMTYNAVSPYSLPYQEKLYLQQST